MRSNLRSMPIEGHVTDSAGNVIQNAEIIIKQITPHGSFSIDSTISDDSGYFKTKPLPNGEYDIYESLVRISRISHVANHGPIPCFAADADNYNSSAMQNYFSLKSAHQLQKYKTFIQIESPYINIMVYGNTYPIYDINIANDPAGSIDNSLFNLSDFLGLSAESRITTTRFDVEYFIPQTHISSQYKRIRWAGVPAIKFYPDSQLVIPLDFFSIVPNLPKIRAPEVGDFTSSISFVSLGSYSTLSSSVDQEFINSINYIFDGDIVRIVFLDAITSNLKTWYGIVDTRQSTVLEMEKWNSSRYISDTIVAGDIVKRIEVFDGIFANISNINEEVNSRFTVIENVSAQNNSHELYTYNNKL